jgi:hypothetical protein
MIKDKPALYLPAGDVGHPPGNAFYFYVLSVFEPMANSFRTLMARERLVQSQS